MLLGTRSFKQITKDDLTDRGFSQIDSFLALSTLRFLGIVNNDDNTVTDTGNQLRMMGDEKKKALQVIVKMGYGKLFEIAPNANNLTRKELYNEFVGIYKLSPRVAGAAVPVFLWLCGEAGLDVQKAIQERKVQPRRDKAITVKSSGMADQKKPAQALNENQDFVLPYGSIKLVLPNNDKARNALVDGQFKEVGKQLLELSKLMEDKVSDEIKEL